MNGLDRFPLEEVARELRRHALVLGAIVVVATATAAVLSFLAPPVYRSEASLLPKNGSTGMSLAGVMAGLSGGAANPMAGLVGNQSAVQLAEVLNSRSLAERVVRRTHLDADLSGRVTNSAKVAYFRQLVHVVPPSLKTTAYTLQVDYKDATRAQQIATMVIEEMKSLLDEIGFNDATRNRVFLERQLARAKTDLANSEQHLATFQIHNPTASLPESVSRSLEELRSLEAQKIEAGVGLTVARKTVDSLEERVRSLQVDPNQLGEWQLKAKSLQSQQDALRAAQDQFITRLTGLPVKSMELARLQRDVQVQNAVYMVLIQQYESAVIAESKDSDAFLVLDPPSLPEYPDKPKKKRDILLGFGAGLLAALLGLLGKVAWSRRLVAHQAES